jgi:hypothetical protein
MERYAFTRACLSHVRVIIAIMHILVVELLCRRRWDDLQYSRTYCQVRVGACGRVLSCQAFNATTSQEPVSVDAYPMLKAPRSGSQEPGYVLSWGDEASSADRW